MNSASAKRYEGAFTQVDAQQLLGLGYLFVANGRKNGSMLLKGLLDPGGPLVPGHDHGANDRERGALIQEGQAVITCRLDERLVKVPVGLGHPEEVGFLHEPFELITGFAHRLEMPAGVPSQPDQALDGAGFQHHADFNHLEEVLVREAGHEVTGARPPLEESFSLQAGKCFSQGRSVHVESVGLNGFAQALPLGKLLEEQEPTESLVGLFALRKLFWGGC